MSLTRSHCDIESPDRPPIIEYLLDELKLSVRRPHPQLFSEYTMTNCWAECLLNMSRLPSDDNCYPWNMPTPRGSPCCNPLQADAFYKRMRTLDMAKTMGEELCLPDCSGTIYTTTVSSAAFRKCDDANMGLTMLCTVDAEGGNSPVPQKWAEDVLREYRKSGSEVYYV